jgi:hypothetical protein
MYTWSDEIFRSTKRRIPKRLDNFATVLVRPDNPLYLPLMVKSRDAHPKEFRHDREGLWVIPSWIISKPAGGRL